MEDKARLYSSAILGVSLVIASGVAAYAFYATRNTDNTLVVTGSATANVTSDTVKWTLDIERTVDQSGMQQGYTSLAKDLAATQAFLASKGIPDSAVTVSEVYVEQVYDYKSQNGGPTQYNLRQELTINSSDVADISALAKNLSALSAQGVFVSQNQLGFYLSTLPQYRVSLLADAIKDARARAESIAGAAGSRVGPLRSASSAAVQVLAPNSIDSVSDYGSYDTSSIDKTVMVTVRATFAVQ